MPTYATHRYLHIQKYLSTHLQIDIYIKNKYSERLSPTAANLCQLSRCWSEIEEQITTVLEPKCLRHFSHL